MKKTLFIFLIIGIMMTVLFTACSEDEPAEENKTGQTTGIVTPEPTQGTDQDQNGKTEPTGTAENSDGENEVLSSKGLSMSVNNSSGELQVNRKKVEDRDTAGLADGWTILVYLC
ncbi:MAG: hypothetical protein IK071_05515 [Lachnospiraceae bacterium]|nr:hypothetical protein [Lachnospiraceae bacterium]